MHKDYYSESESSIPRASRHVLIKILFLSRQQQLIFCQSLSSPASLCRWNVARKPCIVNARAIWNADNAVDCLSFVDIMSLFELRSFRVV